MKDIGPELLEKLKKEFSDNVENSSEVKRLMKLIKDGTADYKTAEDYAYCIGEALAKSFGDKLSSDILPDGRMYYNIAERVLRPLLEDDYKLISSAAADVQTSLNDAAGIGIRAQKAELNHDRINGIIDKVSNAEHFDDVSWVLDEPVKIFSLNVVDETIRKNVEFHGKVGLTPKVIRKAEHKCCKWCSMLAGEYIYPDVPDDVYRRHENCRCTVEYNPGDGKRQNVWTKQWQEPEKYDTLKKSSMQLVQQSGAKKTEGWEERHAERYYEEIRKRAAYSDAKKIAKHVKSFSEEQIELIRHHLFIEKHHRMGTLARFDADYDIAQAWQRLVEGKNVRKSDIILLHHEYTELSIMYQTGCQYEEAHELANEQFNWFKAFLEEK